ncbi:hypothetical protein [Azospirillum sp. TSO5]|uniref:hypothetical protein n=1 Tax=Azospirillum sp. TSO5 TaxID=716760 RepID=UPI000D611D10|nr:hypothetical protein [Azospirillum sp. TSO5]PWC97712.1 hypothetical protein TSO5_04195 [Azospirillum sp. TSO5]
MNDPETTITVTDAAPVRPRRPLNPLIENPITGAEIRYNIDILTIEVDRIEAQTRSRETEGKLDPDWLRRSTDAKLHRRAEIARLKLEEARASVPDGAVLRAIIAEAKSEFTDEAWAEIEADARDQVRA